MAKNDQQEAYERALTNTLARVLDLLKFAEAKNAALIAFDTAWVVGIANLLTKTGGPPAGYDTILPVSATLFIFSAVVALISFTPQIDFGKFKKGEQRQFRAANLVFYGDIASIALCDVPTRLRQRYLPGEKASATDAYLDDLAEQICVNSCIARSKFKVFTWAARVSLLGVALLTLPSLEAVSHSLMRCLGR